MYKTIFYIGRVLSILFVSNLAFGLDIIKKKNDEREFDYFTLENQLKVMVISDADAPKSAASLNIDAGSGEDPFDRQGMAHFLEHMLFLGSKKYPEANALDKFISGHAGSHNAFTSLLNTNYFFDIDSSFFEGGLDRFSSMFESPTLSEKYIERERLAVHSEFTSKFNSDYRRARDVLRELVLPNHSIAKFATGNSETLSVKAPRPLVEDVRAFYDAYYHASNMSLVLYGPQTIEVLTSLAKKYFSNIQNSKAVRHETFDSLFPKGFSPSLISIQPVKEIRSLSLMFSIPDSEPYFREKPIIYIGHLLGHEGQGSLLSILREKGWATALSAGSRLEWRGGEAFSIEIQLTEQGNKNIAAIEALFFDYLALVKNQGVEKWRFNELKNLGTIGFEYGEPVDPIHQVIWLSSRMHRIDPSLLLYEPYMYEKFDPELINQFLSYISPENLVKILMSPDAKVVKTSNIYETKYAVTSEKDVNTAKSSGVDQDEKLFKLPSKNQFIPDEFNIVEQAGDVENQKKPVEIIKSKQVSAWFANDNTFDTPKASLKARYILPNVAKSPKNFIVTQIFSRIIRESISEVTYDASIGGLRYSMGANYRGLNIDFEGYNQTLPNLVNTVMERVEIYLNDASVQGEINKEYFDYVKSELERSANNKLKDKPTSKIFRDIPSVIYRPYWSAEDIRNAYQKITLDEYKSVLRSIFDFGSVQLFAFGNLKKKDSKNYAKILTEVLSSESKNVGKIEGRVVRLSQNKGPLIREVVTDETDSAVVMYFQGENDTMIDRASVLVLQQMVSTPFFNRLRTELQLGYIVYTTNYPFKDTPGFLAVVQSPDKNAQQIYDQIQKFFWEYKFEILNTFEQDRASVISSLEEKANNQQELADRFWSQILKERYSFDEREKLIKAVEKISVKQIEVLYDELFNKNLRNIIFVSTTGKPLEIKGSHLIDDESKFKNQSSYYAYP